MKDLLLLMDLERKMSFFHRLEKKLLISARQQKTWMKSQRNGIANGRHSAMTGRPPHWLQVVCLAPSKKPWNRWNEEIPFNSICCCPVLLC